MSLKKKIQRLLHMIWPASREYAIYKKGNIFYNKIYKYEVKTTGRVAPPLVEVVILKDENTFCTLIGSVRWFDKCLLYPIEYLD